MAHLSLVLLGPFQATLDGQPIVGFASQRVRALLAYLAVEASAGTSAPRAHARETLAGLFWPGYPDPSAFANLRQALANLRQALGDREADPPCLLISRETIQFNAASDYRLDVALLSGAARDGARDDLAIERATQAAALYRGPFLDGLSLDDSPAFEEWVTLQREQCTREMIEVLQRLATHHAQRGDIACCQAYAQQQVESYPTQEEGQRQLMRALAWAGQRSAALAQYQSCRRVLAEQVGVEPAEETMALFEAIRQGRIGPAAVTASTVAVPPGQPLSPATLTPEPDEGPDPPQPLFVAREEELAQLDRWLGEALAGQGRVGFVVGEPGSGKTALAREFARRAMEQHLDLIVAWGNGNAYSGLGDPYLPFIEVLAMLTADIEGQRAAGSLSREHARRLRAIYPTAVGALLEGSLGLVDLFLPSVALLARGQSLAASGPERPVMRNNNTSALVRSVPVRASSPQSAPASGTIPIWMRLEEALQRRGVLASATPVSQTDLFQQVTRFVQALARQQPLLLVLDDLQWADAASLALLFHLGRHLAGYPILVLGLYRPEEVAAGRDGQPHPLAAVLAEFQRLWGRNGLDLALAEGLRLVNALLDSEPNRLGSAFRQALYERTSGHALFTVELWRGLQERGDLIRDVQGHWVERSALDWGQLPARVEAAIAATVDRLPATWHELLTVASVEGEEFTAEVVAKVLGADERQVTQALSGPLSSPQRLVRAISLQRLGTQRLSRYRFRHALFQEYIYGRLDEVERCRLHEEVGMGLEALYNVNPRSRNMERSPLAEVVSELEGEWFTQAEENDPNKISQAVFAPQLARHFAIAGLTQTALAYTWEAAETALSHLATKEMIAHCRGALDLLRALPPTPQRLQYERKLQGRLGVLLGNFTSWVLPDVRQAHLRESELARQIGPLEECVALLDLAQSSKAGGDPRLACESAERAVALAQDLHPTLLIAARARWAQGQIHCADFVAAARNLDALVAPCLGTEPPPLPSRYWFHLHDLSHAAWALWCLGYPERALRVARVVQQMGYATENNMLVIQALCDAACFTHQLRREVRAVQQGVDELNAVVSEGRDPSILRPFAPLYRGWVQVQCGALEEGIAALRQGLAAWDAGFGVLRAHFRGYLAEALGMAGRAKEGLALLGEALAEVERTGDRFSLAETWRLKGELLLKDEGGRRKDERESSAEECFLKAIVVAQEQEARSWELRATLSLARLWQRQGKAAEAREALAAIYGWFTEGFDTPDLVEARELLAELGSEG